jgi:transposase-like protein
LEFLGLIQDMKTQNLQTIREAVEVMIQSLSELGVMTENPTTVVNMTQKAKSFAEEIMLDSNYDRVVQLSQLKQKEAQAFLLVLAIIRGEIEAATTLPASLPAETTEIYHTAAFLMHRIRFAMTPGGGTFQKLKGIVECDETYIGGRPRRFTGFHKPGRGTKKTPVFGMVQRDGNIHRRVVANVSGKTLKSAIRECVDKDAMIITDEWPAYRGIGKEFNGGHAVINHGLHQYANGGISTNTAESSFAILKRGITGIYHNVSKKHLHRYVGEFDFRWNTRKINDGERVVMAVQSAQGKRLDYKTLIR